LIPRRPTLPAPDPLTPDQLCADCDADCFDFQTTAELEPLDEVIGQERAVESICFGIDIHRSGFNIFAFGPAGSGKSTTIQHFLGRQAVTRPVPDGWCYVMDFEQRHHPRALRLPPGRASQLCLDMSHLVEELLVAIPSAFETDAYGVRRGRLSAESETRARANFEVLQAAAAGRSLAVVQGEDGIQIAPVSNGEVMSSSAFSALPAADQAAINARVEETEAELETTARTARLIEWELREALDALDREVAAAEVATRLEPLRERYADLPVVLAYLAAVEADVLDHLAIFRTTAGNDNGPGQPRPIRTPAREARAQRQSDRRLRRYEVNVLVDHRAESGAPVVVESHPTLGNLVGRIEYDQHLGMLATDLTLIKPGALHRANGGYLVIEAEELLKQPQSWDALKRALRNSQVVIEPPGENGGPPTTISLDPEPIPLDIKVILIGDALLYFHLHAEDPDFPELFKVVAEFGDSMTRTDDTVHQYARFIATVVSREQLLPFDKEAVARVIVQSARLAGDAQRLSSRFLEVTDLLREADYWARRRGSAVVGRVDVESAHRAAVRRMDLARELTEEAYARELVLLSTAGEAIGQVNGLTVVSRGSFEFGIPVRITARVRLGGGELVDIEREAELGGPLHSKGVLTLSGYLGGRYVPDDMLAVAASLTFEQSYSEVDGDSASLAELCALLSALAELPLDQALAVTGSVNQAGEVQPIGGVNEKIEGYFDICRLRGLTGDQGVLIPAGNVQLLMLRQDVIAAVAAGTFEIYPVRHVDEAMELLTGLPAGGPQADGQFAEGTVNRRVEDRLRQLAEKRRESFHDGEAHEETEE
jgi:lon-related putative ATP-dependent protease